jgi:hypothetical protein
MTLLSLFRKKRRVAKTPTILSPDDSLLGRRVKEAKWKNAHAVTSFVKAAEKQEHDANLARQIIHDVLERTTDPRPNNHASNKK